MGLHAMPEKYDSSYLLTMACLPRRTTTRGRRVPVSIRAKQISPPHLSMPVAEAAMQGQPHLRARRVTGPLAW